MPGGPTAAGHNAGLSLPFHACPFSLCLAMPFASWPQLSACSQLTPALQISPTLQTHGKDTTSMSPHLQLNTASSGYQALHSVLLLVCGFLPVLHTDGMSIRPAPTTAQMPPGHDPWMTSATTWIHHPLYTVARASLSTQLSHSGRIANVMKPLGTVRKAQVPLVSLQPHPSDSPRRKCPHLQPGLSSLRNTHLSPTSLSRCA